LGNSNTIKLLDLVNIIGECLNKKPILEFYPEQEGDVPHTFSDIQKSIEILGYHPKTNIRDGIKKQVACFKSSLA
jgi:UDP-glucuronate 4-epimerase